MKSLGCCLIATITLSGCIRSTETRAVQSAAEAMGGKDKIQAVGSLSIEGEGEEGNLGQNFVPDSPLTKWKLTGYTQVFDFDNKRMRVNETRTAQFQFAGENPSQQNTFVDQDVAWNKTGDQASPRMSARVAGDRQMELLHNPIGILRAALDPKAKLSRSRDEGNQQLVDVATASGQMLTLGIDKTTHLPSSVTSAADQPNLGDVDLVTTFEDYQDVGGLKLPMHMTTKVDKWVRTDLHVSRYVLNPDTKDLAAPGSLKAEAAAPAVVPANVTVENVAPGIWFLGGSGNHHSIAFEFSDHLTLFELPESEARAKAVIEKAHSLKFGKPLTEVIISHHHFDHSAGLRVAAANNLTIITERANIPFFKELLLRRHTIVPDELAATLAPEKAQFKPVDDQLVLKDSSMELDLYHVKDNSHTDTLLMCWVPAQHILVQADLYDSGWLRQPWADNLLKNVTLRKLNPEKDVPVHGGVQPWSEVVATLKAKGGA